MPVFVRPISRKREKEKDQEVPAEVSHIAETLPLDQSPFELHRLGVIRRFANTVFYQPAFKINRLLGRWRQIETG
jgi:hypothetical protein